MKLKEFLCKLFCKLPRWLRNALCWAYREIIVDIRKFYFSADTWKDFWGFIKNIMGDFSYALKMWIKKVFKGERPLPIPLKKGVVPLPGSNSRYEMFKRLIIMMAIAGILIGCGLKFFPIVVELIIITFLFALLFALPSQINKYHLGYLGERAVAEELEKYGRNPKWRVFHSFLIPGFNGDIDHIVICSNGIFCVETKTLRSADKITVQDGKIFHNGEKFEDKFGKNPVKRTRKASGELHKFLERECSPAGRYPYEVPRVFPVIIFTGELVEKDISIKRGEELIIGSSEKIKEIFEEVGQKQGGKKDAPVLTEKDIETISGVLEQESRSDIKEDKELLE